MDSNPIEKSNRSAYHYNEEYGPDKVNQLTDKLTTMQSALDIEQTARKDTVDAKLAALETKVFKGAQADEEQFNELESHLEKL